MITNETPIIPVMDVKPVTSDTSYAWVAGAIFELKPLLDTYIPLHKTIFGDKV